MNKTKTFFLIVSLCAAISVHAQSEKCVFRGSDPKWQSQSNWYSLHGGANGLPDWRFQFRPGSFVSFYSRFEGRDFFSTAMFTSNSVVNYKNKTVTLWIGTDNHNKDKYITVERVRCQFLFD